MANLPKIVYNFNENDATTIRDYSENGNDGVGTNITIAASTRVGNDAVFNSATDQINLGNITDLNGAASCGIHFGINISAGASTKTVLRKGSQIRLTYDYSTNAYTFSLGVASGTASVVSDSLVVGTFYDLDIRYESNVLELLIDGVSVDTDNTQSGNIVSDASDLLIGDSTASDSALFLLNEFKLYSSNITDSIIGAVINEPNGVYTLSEHEFNVGDIIFTNLDTTPLYGIVTFIETGAFRFLPLSDGISGAFVFRRGGHLWDTTRQWGLLIDDTPKVCFYDGQSISAEIFTDAKKTVCITKDGITGGNVIKNSVTKTANYTILDTDERIYVDSSGGAFTITLPASPDDNKEYEIIDSTGNCASFNVTVNGNGNDINGSNTGTITSNNEAWGLVYNGTQWNLK
jgi:hypothetical protein